MKLFKALAFTLFVLIITVLFNTKLASVPPLGKFFDPFHGFWQNAEKLNGSFKDELFINGLKDAVKVSYDDRRIPHLFASNEHDVYFAQGYLTAKDRLWQMDFQTRFAAGKLSEVVGSKAIELDKYQRRMGMGFGAENMIKAVNKFAPLKAVLQAYADGVNAYIESLKPEDYPLEFKILDYKPQKWEIINTAYLLKLMSESLAGGSDEFYMSNVLHKFGPQVTANLFPDYPFRESPIIPVGTELNFKAVNIPKPPAEYLKDFAGGIETKQKVDGIGSNNWAVAGSKTASGFPMLANDPHLELSLPAIWYQVQLNAPGMNVYGVSIPGSPCVIIGFNEQVAWGVTNVGADVLDWYRVKFDAAKRNYWFNNQWHPLTKRIEKIFIRGAKPLLDTVLYTHQGPVVYTSKQKPKGLSKADNVPTGYALRWVAHDPSLDVWTFHQLNKAQNYSDYRQALRFYSAPAQNFAFADAHGDIAITANGYIPLKWKDQGKFLLDGTEPENEWHGRIPVDQNPTVKNPTRGFISSANQSSTDKKYPYYVNWEFSATERARRINQRLSVMKNATLDSMRSLQNDNYSLLAEELVPVFVSSINTEKLNASQSEALDKVRNWNRFYNADEIAASIFEIWQHRVIDNIWDEFKDKNLPMRQPNRDRTVQLILAEPQSKWFDKLATPKIETREDIIGNAFIFAVDSLYKKYGPMSKKWNWANVKHSNVPHLAKIPGLGSVYINIGGSKSSVNAVGESHGPSWRMVVALGKTITGYGVFPGGESGNPGSFYYDNMINTWASGKLDQLHLLKSPTQTAGYIKQKITLNHR